MTHPLGPLCCWPCPGPARSSRELLPHCAAAYDAGRLPAPDRSGSTVVDLSSLAARPGAGPGGGGSGGGSGGGGSGDGGGGGGAGEYALIREGASAARVCAVLEGVFGLRRRS
jgi:hypothetical protein